MTLDEVKKTDFHTIPVDTFWNVSKDKERKIHKIHSYPAKFPAFMTTKALEYARAQGMSISWIADIFCGCGTVAFEAKRNNINFWGCDINPVATLIAKTKSNNYKTERLERYQEQIIESYMSAEYQQFTTKQASERIEYWFEPDQIAELLRLKNAIEKVIAPQSSYKSFFLCAFSNILKATSRWLTKSIKPQIDPHKKTIQVLLAFQEQCRLMIQAFNEIRIEHSPKRKIINANFLDISEPPSEIDLIITSPPYVTSYEYADLHQLSSLWLEYTNDYRDLRKGSIGSLHHCYNFNKELKNLNQTGSDIVFRLIDQHKQKAYSVAKYFLDMQQVAAKCFKLLAKNGLALFVIGNTEYKGVRIDNAKHLAESLLSNGFIDIFITKRTIQNKILTPYRDKLGRFTTDSNSRKVYSEEFILIGRKND